MTLPEVEQELPQVLVGLLREAPGSCLGGTRMLGRFGVNPSPPARHVGHGRRHSR